MVTKSVRTLNFTKNTVENTTKSSVVFEKKKPIVISLEDKVDQIMDAPIDPKYQRIIKVMDKRRNLSLKA
jgi:hypothetical protein